MESNEEQMEAKHSHTGGSLDRFLCSGEQGGLVAGGGTWVREGSKREGKL